MKMATRSQFYQLALEANERQANFGDDVLPVPTLDERVTLYLRAVYGNREFTEEERSNARNALLDSMAAEIAAQVQPDVTEPRPLHPYEAPTQYRQSVRRKETIRVVPIARRSLSTPGQHVVQIASQRSEADVLAVFRRLQQEQPTLFGQATLSRIDLGPQSYSARVGPFASEKDAAAACLALAAADIRCF